MTSVVQALVRFYKESGAELDLGVFWLVKMCGQGAFQAEEELEKSLRGEKPGAKSRPVVRSPF